MITKFANVGGGMWDRLTENVVMKSPRIAGTAAILSSFALSKAIRTIQNNTRKKALIEDLMTTDPIISKADKAQVLEYYALIDNIAPAVSLERPIVRELLQSFIRFGRVDINTLKMLTETQKNHEAGKGNSSAAVSTAVALGGLLG